MTKKDIEKLINKSYLILFKNKKQTIQVFISDVINKESLISDVVHFVNKIKCLAYFYSFDESTGEMFLLSKIDHIDIEKKNIKKKKIIKKKLDDMTEEEIQKLFVKYCHHTSCNVCPLCDCDNSCCMGYFFRWKKLYENNKDKEFGLEVEE